MKAKMNIVVFFEDASSMHAALKALEQKNKTQRTQFSVLRSGDNKLTLSIIASDATALRATANSSMRILQTIEAIENAEKGV